MDHLVTINNNSSEDENTNDSATSASTASTVSTSGRGKNKVYEKTGTFNAKEEAQNFLAKQKLWTFRSTRSICICMMLLIHRHRHLQLNRLKQ